MASEKTNNYVSGVFIRFLGGPRILLNHKLSNFISYVWKDSQANSEPSKLPGSMRAHNFFYFQINIERFTNHFEANGLNRN